MRNRDPKEHWSVTVSMTCGKEIFDEIMEEVNELSFKQKDIQKVVNQVELNCMSVDTALNKIKQILERK